MSGFTATSMCMYVTKIMEASTHLRCAHTWGDADSHSTECELAEVFSTVQLILSCWENCREYLSPVSEVEVENGTPFEFRTSSARASWERTEVFLETEWRKLLQLFVSDYFEMSDKNREKRELLWIFILNKEHLWSLASADLSQTLYLQKTCWRLSSLVCNMYVASSVCISFSLLTSHRSCCRNHVKVKKINSKFVLQMMKELQLKFHPEPFWISWWFYSEILSFYIFV